MSDYNEHLISLAGGDGDEANTELQGLPNTISKALRAHPYMVKARNRAEKATCAGETCDWEKPTGIAARQAWVRHQTWAVHLAVAAWYFNE